MSSRFRIAFFAVYPVYCVLAVAVLMQFDLPELLSRLYPFPRPTVYDLQSNPLSKFEAYTKPWTIWHVEDCVGYELIPLGGVPSLKGTTPCELFHDPAYRGESVVWNPDERYEKDFIYSVKRPFARVFLFGDSYMLASTYKHFAYLLNEEYGIPTFRRTFYAKPGPMETIYGFIRDSPDAEVRGKTLLLEVSEGATPLFVSPQVIGTPVRQLFHALAGSVLYRIGSRLPLDRWLHHPGPEGVPPPLPTVHTIDKCPTPAGRFVHTDPAHFNPLVFEYEGRCYAVGFYERNAALLTWDGLLFDAYEPRISIANWLRRISALAHEKGLRVAVLFVPSKLNTYWPIVGPILDYDKALAFIRKNNGFNATIHSGDALRAVLPKGLRSWREFYAGVCRRESLGFIDLTEPFRRETLEGRRVYTDLGTHWNYHGVRVAAETTVRWLRENGYE